MNPDSHDREDERFGYSSSPAIRPVADGMANSPAVTEARIDEISLEDEKETGPVQTRGSFPAVRVQRPATALVRKKRSNSIPILAEFPPNVHERFACPAPQPLDVGILLAGRLTWACSEIDQNTVFISTSNQRYLHQGGHL